jgi:lambda family phage tail tape measure protein
MAKTLEELLIKLGVDGIDEVKQLKGSLRQLQQTAKISDQDIEKLAKGIKNYTRVVGTSEKAVRGQIAALKGAREQAQIGGKAYNDLTRDIERYEKRLKSVGNTSEETGKKVLSAAQILAQFPARKPSAFSAQINQLNKDLADLKVNTDAYVLQLRKIQEREDSFRQAQARQSVIARAQTAAGAVVDPRAAITISTALPKTTAALSLRVSELKENLQNLDFTSNQYRDTQREILSIEKQLADATNQRIEAIKGVTEQQRRAEQLAERSRGRKQRLLANQAAADAEYNAALGAHIAAPAMPARQLSSLYQSISQISAAGMAREVEMMGNSYRKVAADINLAARAGGNSISSLQGQRVAFDSLRNVLDPTSREFRQVSRQIQTLDKRLGRLTRTTSRFSKANLLQGAGAVASSAIFGGPLGALGSLGGFLLGGPGGAALGGGLGASANILVDYGRQIAEINTQLNLSKQTLALASNGQEEYNTLLEVARNISRDYAVSLKETIGGFSQVAVAARANNLTLQETETIFRGLVSAGIAFGKSQQDIDAIVRATVQVLSKGKLSAEELQGQIGERLPGAVAKFAEATGRSLPQLAKDLKAGTVQISDFVDFSKKQLFDYDKVAKLIADGPEKAGARLKLALEESAENYGGFFQRVGAKFQDFGTDLLNFFNDNQETIQNFVVDSIIAFKNLALEVKLAFEDIKGSILFLKPVLDAFTTGIDVIGKANRRQRALQAGGFDDAAYRQQAAEFARKNVMTGSEVFNPLDFQRIFRQEFNRLKGEAVVRGEAILREQTGDTVPGREALRQQLFGDFIPYTTGKYPPGTKPDGSPDPTDPPKPPKDIDAATRDARIAALALRERGLQLTKQQIIDAGKLAEEAAKLLPPNLQLVKIEEIRVDTANKLFRLKQDQDRQAEEDKRKTKEANDLLDRQYEIRLKASRTLQDARNAVTLMSQEERQRIEINRQVAAFIKEYAGVLSSEELHAAMTQFRADLEEANSAAFKFRQGLREVFDEAMNVAEAVGEVGVNAVNSLGDAFADFVTTGKANFRDFANSVISDLARIFAKKALFQGLSLIPGVGSFLGLGASVAGGGGGGGDSFAGVPNNILDSVLGNANGNVFAKNKIVPYAMGGIVNKPTLFQYANGGSGRFGLMGEAGPEAIMPLRRGANGKLGVEASGGAMGNVVVNVDAAGSSVEGDASQLNQLGKAIGIAVQQELVKQKRPGGLLAT